MTPFISSDQSLPEITPRGLILGIFLVVILAAANAYLGLKMGTTVAASIPASVAAMGVLSFFKNSNILEYNIVQTAASSGESIISGIAFILPAMIIIHYWVGFNYWETAFICLTGGILGVIFSIPLRRILFAEKLLRFPEGTAIGQVLIAGSKNRAELKYLVSGGIIGSLISFSQTGLQLLKNSLVLWFNAGNTFVYGFALGFDPALFAAGYIVGINVAVSMLLGVIIGWLFGIPILSFIQHSIHPLINPADIAQAIWRNNSRYIGIGTMLIGGFWILVTLFKPLWEGIKTSFISIKSVSLTTHQQLPRTERDIPFQYVGWCILLLMIPLGFLSYHFASSEILNLDLGLKITIVTLSLLFILFVGFVLAALSGYTAGLIGYTNSPTSALMLIALLLFSTIVLLLFGLKISFNPQQTIVAGAFAIMVASIISTANCLTGETTQDLKAGQIVGATPWKQQLMMILGVIVASFATPLILQLLFNAYGIGGIYPRSGMDPTQMLSAPQATLAATLVQATFNHNLPWLMIGIGGLIAVGCIIVDQILRERGMRLPTLAVGLGIYLPVEVTIPVIIGGFVSYFIGKTLHRRFASAEIILERQQRGLILACGLVAGAALMGVILAIPFAIAHSTDVLKIVPDNFDPIAYFFSIVVMISLIYWVYRSTCKLEK